MDLRPEDILYRPATNIEMMPCAYVKGYTAGSPPSIEVSNVNWFLEGQSLQFLKPSGSIITGAVGASDAIDPLAKTIELDSAPSTLPALGDTVLGPPLLGMGGTTGGLQWRETPEIITPEYDQVEGHVRIIKPHWDIECAFTLMEFNMAQWATAMQQSYSSRAASTPAAALTGTLASTGTTVTGTGTAFQTDLEVGDVIVAAGQTLVVATIVSDTSLTTESAASPALSGATFALYTNPIAGARIFDDTGDFVKPMGVRFTVEHPDPDQDLFFYILLFQAASITGIDTAFDKRTPTQLPVTIKALADVDRPRKKRFRMIIQEISPAG